MNDEQPSSPPIECVFSETEPLLKSITDIDTPHFDDTSKQQYLESYFGENGCGCERQCHRRFPLKAFESRLDALNLDRYCPQHVNHQHLLLLGAINALIQDKNLPDKKSTVLMIFDLY